MALSTHFMSEYDPAPEMINRLRKNPKSDFLFVSINFNNDPITIRCSITVKASKGKKFEYLAIDSKT